jgi:hypothetical protein
MQRASILVTGDGLFGLHSRRPGLIWGYGDERVEGWFQRSNALQVGIDELDW